MPRADGSIIIDTKVNTKGMQSGVKDISSQMSNIGGKLKAIGGLAVKAFAIKQVVAFAKECIELGSDLEEVQNVVDVTFGKMSNVIDNFAQSAATQFGLSELAAKQYTSTLGAMYKSMGFTEDAAAGMSIEMTKLAADMASFYNLDADTAFQKIRSGISGETEPLKQLGINLSEANLEEFRLAQGIEVAYNKMTQQDKALLRYNYLLHVTSDAQGDFARTSGSWANQVKVLNLQFQSIKANLGQAFINIFTPVLKVINTVLEGLAKVAAAFKAFTEMLTGKKSESGSGQITGVDETAGLYQDAADSAEDYAEATEDVADATKAAAKANKGYLSGLDDIRKFESEKSTATSTSPISGKPTTGSGTSGSVIPIPTFDFGQVKAEETAIDGLSDKMTDLFTKIQKGVQPTIKALQNLYNNGLKKVGSFVWDSAKDFLDKFLAPIAKWTMGEGIPRFLNALNDGLMKIDWKKIQDALGKIWEALEPLAENVGDGLLWFWEEVLVPFGVWLGNEVITRFLKTLREGIRLLNVAISGAKTVFIWLFDNFLKPIASWTADKFMKAWDGINSVLEALADFFEGHPEKLQELKGKIEKKWGEIKSAIALKVNAIKNHIAEKFKNITTAIGQTWTDIKNGIVNAWTKAKDSIVGKVKSAVDAVKSTISDVFGKIGGVVSGVWTTIKNGIANAWTGTKNSIKSALSAAATTIKDTVGGIIEKLSTKVGNVWTSIKNGIAKAWTSKKESIQGALTAAATTIKTKVGEALSGVAEKVGGVWSKIKSGVSKAWTAKDSILSALSSALGTVKSTLKDKAGGFADAVAGAWSGVKSKAETAFKGISTVITNAFKAPTISTAWNTIKNNLSTAFDKIKGAAETMKKGVSEAFGKMFDGVLNIIRPPFNAVARVINSIIRGVVTAINAVTSTVNKLSFTVPSWVPGIGGKRFGFNLPQIYHYPQVPLLAQGAVIPPNAPFTAILGDQKNGKNIETPEALLRQIVREESGQDNGSYTFIAELDGNVLFKKVIKKAQLQKTQTGHNPFEMAMG